MANFNRRPAIDRFMEKVMPVPEAGCWLWSGAAKPGGYGNFYLDGGYESAHRASMILHGRDPGEYTCHKCDTPLCVNPDHLFAGTAQDNHDDMRAKGRANYAPPRGENNGQAKFTRAQVDEIRGSSERTAPLARRLGVTYQAVWAIRKGRTWKDAA